MNESQASKQAIRLILVSVCSSITMFVLSVVLARMLGTEGFQEYIVAIAAISLLGTFCEFGTGKYALKALPQYTKLQQWGLAAGYWRFCLAVVLLLSVIVMLIVLGGEIGHDGQFGDYLLGIAVLFLPSTALVAVVSELVMANRAPIRGTLVTKLLCPIITLVLVGTVYGTTGRIDSTAAILCFGVAGLVGLLVAVAMFFQTSPREIWSAAPEKNRPEWIRNCAWFFVLAFVMSWLFDISVIVLEMADVADIEIARYGAAAKTGCFILLVAKSTNKLYQPEVSVIMSTNDWSRAVRLRRARLILIGSACVAFVAVMVFFGKPILRLFGPEYEPAHLCLILVSIGASVLTLYSMAPEFLKFMGKLKTVLGIQIGGAVLLFGLTWWLGERHGATGAGAAFCIVMVGMTTAFLSFSNRKLSRLVEQHSENET